MGVYYVVISLESYMDIAKKIVEKYPETPQFYFRKFDDPDPIDMVFCQCVPITSKW